MPWSEKSVKEAIEKNRKYLDALEASDKSRKLSLPKKIRKNFTVDEDIFLEFQARCRRKKQSMSAIVEELMKKY